MNLAIMIGHNKRSQIYLNKSLVLNQEIVLSNFTVAVQREKITI